MKKKFFIVAVATMGLIACNKADLADNSLPAPQKAGANNDSYSSYILKYDEVCSFVLKDLARSGGEFAKKQIASAEPILFSDFEFALEDLQTLQEEQIIEIKDPAFYLVHFKDGGYAIVFPDKDFGVTIIHAQTEGETSKEEICEAPPVPGGDPWAEPEDMFAPHYWRDKMIAWVMYLYHRQMHLYDEEHGWEYYIHLIRNPTTGPGEDNPWSQWYVTNTNEVPTSFFVSAGYPLNQHPEDYTLSTLAPAMIEFLGFFEQPSTLFNVEGDWSAIKSDHGSYPAPEWALKINTYCFPSTTYGYFSSNFSAHFSRAKDFLLLECGGNYPNANILQLAPNDFSAPVTDTLSDIIASRKPVLVWFKSGAGFAWKEEFLRRDRYYMDSSEYDSRIYYKVSTEAASVDDRWTLRSCLESLYYIAY
jgi:hypothetical protein